VGAVGSSPQSGVKQGPGPHSRQAAPRPIFGELRRGLGPEQGNGTPGPVVGRTGSPRPIRHEISTSRESRRSRTKERTPSRPRCALRCSRRPTRRPARGRRGRGARPGSRGRQGAGRHASCALGVELQEASQDLVANIVGPERAVRPCLAIPGCACGTMRAKRRTRPWSISKSASCAIPRYAEARP